jgi:hypothetical protein
MVLLQKAKINPNFQQVNNVSGDTRNACGACALLALAADGQPQEPQPFDASKYFKSAEGNGQFHNLNGLSGMIHGTYRVTAGGFTSHLQTYSIVGYLELRNGKKYSLKGDMYRHDGSHSFSGYYQNNAIKNAQWVKTQGVVPNPITSGLTSGNIRGEYMEYGTITKMAANGQPYHNAVVKMKGGYLNAETTGTDWMKIALYAGGAFLAYKLLFPKK